LNASLIYSSSIPIARTCEYGIRSHSKTARHALRMRIFLAIDDVGECGDIPPAEPGQFGFFQTGTASLPFDFSTNLAKLHDGVKPLLRGTDPAIENLDSKGVPLIVGGTAIISLHQ
jgi:hypothetical protein